MNQTVPMLLVTALVLVFLSYLLYMRLGSAGIARGRIVAALVELWATFAVIIVDFALLDRLLAATPRAAIDAELSGRFAAIRALPPTQQAIIYGGLLLALGLFAHLLWSLRGLLAQAPYSYQQTENPDDQSTE